jgi:hypothetical protein
MWEVMGKSDMNDMYKHETNPDRDINPEKL